MLSYVGLTNLDGTGNAIQETPPESRQVFLATLAVADKEPLPPGMLGYDEGWR